MRYPKLGYVRLSLSSCVYCSAASPDPTRRPTVGQLPHQAPSSADSRLLHHICPKPSRQLEILASRRKLRLMYPWEKRFSYLAAWHLASCTPSTCTMHDGYFGILPAIPLLEKVGEQVNLEIILEMHPYANLLVRSCSHHGTSGWRHGYL